MRLTPVTFYYFDNLAENIYPDNPEGATYFENFCDSLADGNNNTMVWFTPNTIDNTWDNMLDDDEYYPEFSHEVDEYIYLNTLAEYFDDNFAAGQGDHRYYEVSVLYWY